MNNIINKYFLENQNTKNIKKTQKKSSPSKTDLKEIIQSEDSKLSYNINNKSATYIKESEISNATDRMRSYSIPPAGKYYIRGKNNLYCTYNKDVGIQCNKSTPNKSNEFYIKKYDDGVTGIYYPVLGDAGE